MDILTKKNEIQSDVDGTYDALVLEMSLRSSMYATMAIREFTRMDTGKTYQSKLTDEHHEHDKSLEVINPGTKRSIDDIDNHESHDLSKLPKMSLEKAEVELKIEQQ